jgi:sulfur-oxidizing protein SoxY
VILLKGLGGVAKWPGLVHYSGICMLRFALALLIQCVWIAPSAADIFEGDPFQSHQWVQMRQENIGKARAVFDARVKVLAPEFAEDAMSVPVQVTIEGLADVQRVMVLVDRNPIRKVLEFQAFKAKPALSFRFKLEQGSPVRALALTKDGVWHVGGVMVNAAGGGCTVPGNSRADGSWPTTLGQVKAQWVQRAGDESRLRLRVMHPMDTGLVSGIPAFYLKSLDIRDQAGALYMRLKTFEPISENPLFSLDFPGQAPRSLVIVGVDNNGNKIRTEFKP